MIDLHQLRRRIGLTQAQAAEKMGISPRTWRDWEKGTSGPIPILRQLEERFGAVPFDLKADNPNPTQRLLGIQRKATELLGLIHCHGIRIEQGVYEAMAAVDDSLQIILASIIGLADSPS